MFSLQLPLIIPENVLGVHENIVVMSFNGIVGGCGILHTNEKVLVSPHDKPFLVRMFWISQRLFWVPEVVNGTVGVSEEVLGF